VPSQVLPQADGRIAISFMNVGPGEAALTLKAKPGAQTDASAASRTLTTKKSWEAPFEGETERERLSERAHQDRDIVYFLQQPETHSFSLYHDYTESRPGVNRYLNVVREGSKASNPSAYILDTGEKLTTRVMNGTEMAAEKIQAEEAVGPTTEVVLIPFTPVKKGQSIAYVSLRPTPLRPAMASTATTWSLTAAWGGRATPWFCQQAGTSWPARFPHPSGNCRMDESALISGMAGRTPWMC
jgi:hypothetical protein